MFRYVMLYTYRRGKTNEHNMQILRNSFCCFDWCRTVSVPISHSKEVFVRLGPSLNSLHNRFEPV